MKFPVIYSGSTDVNLSGDDLPKSRSTDSPDKFQDRTTSSRLQVYMKKKSPDVETSGETKHLKKHTLNIFLYLHFRIEG
jgi:hypothetical protein